MTNTRRYLLTGFAVCTCSAKLVPQPSAPGTRSYVCSTAHGGCGKRRILAIPTEDQVVDRFLIRLDEPAVMAEVARLQNVDDGVDLSSAITKAQKKLAALTTRWANDDMDDLEYESARPVLQAKLAALQAQAATYHRPHALARYVGQGASLRAAWKGLELEEQRAILASNVASVEIRPGVRGRNVFDAERIYVNWIV